MLWGGLNFMQQVLCKRFYNLFLPKYPCLSEIVPWWCRCTEIHKFLRYGLHTSICEIGVVGIFSVHAVTILLYNNYPRTLVLHGTFEMKWSGSSFLKIAFPIFILAIKFYSVRFFRHLTQTGTKGCEGYRLCFCQISAILNRSSICPLSYSVSNLVGNIENQPCNHLRFCWIDGGILSGGMVC